MRRDDAFDSGLQSAKADVRRSMEVYLIQTQLVTSKASSYAQGGTSRVYRAMLIKKGENPIPVALKELQNPLENWSEEKV